MFYNTCLMDATKIYSVQFSLQPGNPPDVQVYRLYMTGVVWFDGGVGVVEVVSPVVVKPRAPRFFPRYHPPPQYYFPLLPHDNTMSTIF